MLVYIKTHDIFLCVVAVQIHVDYCSQAKSGRHIPLGWGIFAKKNQDHRMLQTFGQVLTNDIIDFSLPTLSSKARVANK